MRCLGIGIFVFIVVSFGALPSSRAQDATREMDARRLFVEAVRLTRKPPCGLIDQVSIFLAAFLDPKTAKARLSCLDQLAKAAVIHDRLLAEYPETEAAFKAAQTIILSQSDIKTLRKLMLDRIANPYKPKPIWGFAEQQRREMDRLNNNQDKALTLSPKTKSKPKPDQFQALLKNLAKRKVAHARELKQAALPVKPVLPRTTPTDTAVRVLGVPENERKYR